MKNLDKYLSLLDGEVDGLLLTSRYSRHYGAEFDIAEGVAVVAKKGCRYFTDSRYIESAQNNIRGFEVQEVGAGRNYSQRIHEAIADFGITTLGYEEAYITAAELAQYEKNVKAKLLPFHEKISAFRGVKEDWEIALMRRAQAITDKAFSQVITRLKPGMTELELQAELIYCMYKNGATGLAFDPIVVSGPNTSLPHGVAGERVIREGDFVTMDFGASYQGYCSDMTRTVAVGFATEEMQKVYNAVWGANTDALKAVRADITGKLVDNVARSTLDAWGYGEYFTHGLGNGVGLEIHEPPTLSARSPFTLHEGMVVTIEPGVYIPHKYGVRIEDMVVVTADGCMNLTKSPKTLVYI